MRLASETKKYFFTSYGLADSNIKKKNFFLVLKAHKLSLCFVIQEKLQKDEIWQQEFAPPPSAKNISSEERKQRWEAGQMDYMGDDSFANIERKLDSFLK